MAAKAGRFAHSLEAVTIDLMADLWQPASLAGLERSTFMSLSITDVNQLIRHRRTIKPITKTGEPNYRDEPLDEALIQNLLENANWAPTHGLTEPWRFQVFQDQAREPLARFFSDMYDKHTDPDKFRPQKQAKLVQYVLNSPCTISLGMKRHEGKIPAEEEVIAVACAVQNMHLTATTLGLGAFWSSSPVYDLPETREYLGLGPLDRCLGMLFVGFPKSDWRDRPGGQPEPINDKIDWRCEA